MSGKVRGLIFLLLTIAVLVLTVPVQAAVVLTNGSFEATGVQYNPALGGLYEASGWTNLSGLNYQASSMLGSQENMPAATDGSRVLRLDSDIELPQYIGRIA